MKIKVLIVGSSLEDKGGIVTVIENILQNVDREMVNIKTISTYLTGSKLLRIWTYFTGILLLLVNLFAFKPDIVHIHMSYKGSFYRKSLIILLLKPFRVPVITHIHGSSFKDFYAGMSPMARSYCYYILNSSTKIVVLSKEWYQFFSTIVNKDKLKILYNAVKPPQLIRTKEENPFPVCLFLGRMSVRKGIFDLLEAVQMIKSRNICTRFILAGDGEVDKVRSIVKDNCLEDYVEVVGWVDKEEKDELLRKSDILILPSYNEGLPMAILEAMSFGLSIISTTVGGIPELVINGENGYLIQAGEVDTLCTRIEMLVDNKKLRQQLRNNNIRRIREDYHIQVFVRELTTMYRSLKQVR
ncbi:glycosyltransferase family 4 protein [Paenibacillus sp. GCM10023250]|uniref:glycosyltransferase family 4 protein n=1 Tax=Paenibacillus sp. GCM10023250 TaxID=3252648 RepID=UPI00361A5F5D